MITKSDHRQYKVKEKNADSHGHRKPWLQISFRVLSYIENLGKRVVMQNGTF